MLWLPAGQEATFWRDLRAYEEERTMPFVTYAERVGREEERLRAVLQAIELRFGAVPPAVTGRVAAVDDLDQLRALFTVAPTAPDLATCVAALDGQPE